MSARRPSERAYARLPVLAAKQHALETCVYCPKLCRTTCPVSNAEPRETLTPWGKMSSAYFMARGDVEIDRDFSMTAWACTQCGACEDFCHHHNPVAETLYATRAALYERGEAPAPVAEVVKSFIASRDAFAARMDRLSGSLGEGAHVLLFAGCTHSEAAVEDALYVVRTLTRERVTLAKRCCGETLRAAGALPEFREHQKETAALLREYSRAYVLDPTCQESLARGGLVVPSVATLVTQHIDHLKPSHAAPPRQHDVARDERAARKVLLRLFARAPAEFESRGGVASGGLLPVTMPHIAAAIGATRKAEHERLGGGVVCTSSGTEASFLRGLGVDVRDFVSLVRAGLEAR
ncbi:MAG: (Fe-S)-binding protein [Polyangiaceae bacterium]